MFNAGLRSSKGWVYGGGIRVPMVVRYPAALPAGSINTQLVHFLDWLPTLTAQCGISPVRTEALDGNDQSPILQGGQRAGRVAAFLAVELPLPDIGTNAAMRDGDWKLVRPMISRTRSYENPALFANPEAARRTAAFIAADIAARASDATRFPSPRSCCRRLNRPNFTIWPTTRARRQTSPRNIPTAWP